MIEICFFCKNFDENSLFLYRIVFNWCLNNLFPITVKQIIQIRKDLNKTLTWLTLKILAWVETTMTGKPCLCRVSLRSLEQNHGDRSYFHIDNISNSLFVCWISWLILNTNPLMNFFRCFSKFVLGLPINSSHKPLWWY